MADVEDLRIILRAEVDKAVSNLKKAARTAKESDKDFGNLAKQFKQQVREATNMNMAFSQMAGSIAAGLGIFTLASKGVTALINLSRESVQAFQVQEQAVAKLEGVLRATGNAAGLTSEEMQAFASELQAATTFGDEAIINLQGTLATFKSVSGDTFKDATRLAVDLSAALGTELQSSAMQLGKALEDPVRGISALQRVGVSFTEAQKEMIKKLVESGDKADAQRIILAELESQVGGVAATMADTATGAMQQYKNIVGDTKEEIGRMILNGLQPLMEGMGKVATAIREVIAEHNNLIEAQRAKAAGTATAEQELLALEDRRKALDDQIIIYQQHANRLRTAMGSYRYESTLKSAIQEREAILMQVRGLQMKQAIQAETTNQAESQLKSWREYKEEEEDAIRMANADIERRAAIAAALGDTFDATKEKMEVLKKSIENLMAIPMDEIDDPFKMTDNTIEELIGQYNALAATIEKTNEKTEELDLQVPDASLARLRMLYGQTEEGIAAAKQETLDFVQAQYELSIAAQAAGEEIAISISEIDAILKNLNDEIKNIETESVATLNQSLEVMVENISQAMEDMLESAFMDFFSALGEGTINAENVGFSMARMAAEATKQNASFALSAGLRVLAEGGTGALPIALALFAIAGVSAFVSGGITKANSGKREVDYERYIVDSVLEEERRMAKERIDILKKQLEDEKRIRDENLKKLENHFSQEFEVLRNLWDRGLISTGDYQSQTAELRSTEDEQRAAVEQPYIDADAKVKAEEDAQKKAKEAIDNARRAKLAALATQANKLQKELNGMSGWDKFWSDRDEKIEKELAQIDRRIQVVQSASSIADIQAAATGADFVTSGPQLLIVGDNPGGKERVQVEPIGSPNINGPKGAETIIININGTILGVDQLYEVLEQAGRRMAGRRRIMHGVFG